MDGATHRRITEEEKEIVTAAYKKGLSGKKLPNRFKSLSKRLKCLTENAHELGVHVGEEESIKKE